MRRDAKHFRELLSRNPAASVGFSLAASAVYASRYGTCEAGDHSTDEWKQIARDLKSRYGDNLTIDDVRAEMKRGVGAPSKNGYAALIQIRVADEQTFARIRDKLTADERGRVLDDASK
jgi:hypothetical protein